jgi:hypothetical protein
MPRRHLIQFRRDAGTPGNGALALAEPGFDMTPARPRLLIGDGTAGPPLVLADPAYIAALEARIRLLEQALRELQFIAHTGEPTFVIPP